MRVYVKTPSRLHLALIDLNGDLGRVDGSMGLALDYPNTILEASRSRKLEVFGEQANFVEDLARRFLQRMRIKGAVTISIRKLIPAHVGLGSGTQLSLAVASALPCIFRIQKTTREMAEIVGRGGTSGIGVMAFEEGGSSWMQVTVLETGKSNSLSFRQARAERPASSHCEIRCSSGLEICSSRPKCSTRGTRVG